MKLRATKEIEIEVFDRDCNYCDIDCQWIDKNGDCILYGGQTVIHEMERLQECKNEFGIVEDGQIITKQKVSYNISTESPPLTCILTSFDLCKNAWITKKTYMEEK